MEGWGVTLEEDLEVIWNTSWGTQCRRSMDAQLTASSIKLSGKDQSSLVTKPLTTKCIDSFRINLYSSAMVLCYVSFMELHYFQKSGFPGGDSGDWREEATQNGTGLRLQKHPEHRPENKERENDLRLCGDHGLSLRLCKWGWSDSAHRGTD